MQELKYQLDMLTKPQWKFVNASAFAKNNLLFLQETGKFCSGKQYFTERSGLDSYLVKVTLSGRGILEYCGETYALTPGSVMFIDCRLPQKYYTDPTADKWEMDWVHFNGSNLRPFYERFLEKNNTSPVSRLASDNTASETIENLIELSDRYHRDQDNEILADYLLHALLKELLLKSGSKASDSPDYVSRIAYYLRHHYREEIVLDTLASEFSLSKFHLQKIFKESVGMSPAKYLQNVRMNRAKSLLRGTNLPVNEVAEEIGMEPNYFIQVFRLTEGMTPGVYRNRWKG